MTQSTYDKIVVPTLVIFILIFGGIWAFKTIYYMYNPEPNKEITFNVVGIVNATNSSIVSIQFECIKYCINHAVSTRESECYDQCAKLGGCDR